MPMLSEEERKKSQELGSAYTTVTGQEVANVAQQQKQQEQSKSVEERTQKALGGKQDFAQDKYLQTGATSKGDPIYSIEPAARELNADSLWGATGFRDWARKTWSQVFDPATSSPFLSPEQQATIPEMQQKLETGLNKYLKWDDWAKGLLGISAEEAAAGGAPIVAETDVKDQFANLVGGAKRSISAGFFTGLNITGGGDYAARKIAALSKTADEVADSVSVLPDIKEYGDFRDYFLQGISIAYNTFRFVTSKAYGTAKGKEILEEKLLRNLNSSRAVYSLLADEMKNDEYIRRYEAGENPQLLAMELENPWVEFAGSIVLDPTTYMGIGVVSKFGKVSKLSKPARLLWFGPKLPWELKYLPTFGEVIGLNIGKGRVLSEAERAFSFADPSIEKSLKNLGNATNDMQAVRSIRTTVESIKDGIVKTRGNYGIAAYSSTAKANIFAKDTGAIINTILSANPSQMELVDEILPAMMKLSRGSDAEILDALATLKNSRVPMEAFLSERGLKTAEAITRLADDGIMQKILNKEGDAFEIGTEILQKLAKISDEMFPSIDEMKKAADAARAGQKLSDKGKQLAEYYENVPDRIKNIRAMTKQYEKIWRPVVGAMAYIFIRKSPAFVPRNILGQGVGLLLDLGAKDAAEITARSARAYSRTMTAKLLQNNADEIFKLTGAVPTRMSQGFGGQDIVKAPLASLSEAIPSSEIFLRVTRDTVQKAMNQGAFPTTEALTKAGMLEDDAKLLLGVMKKNYGSSGKSWDEFKKIVADGQIETFRNLDPPEKVKKMLEETHLWNKFEELRTGARNADEFIEGMAKIKDDYTAAASRVMNDGQALSSEIPAAVQDMAADIWELADEAQVSEEAADLFTRMVQGWRNTRASADQLYLRATQSFHLTAAETLGLENANVLAQKYTQEAQSLFSEYDSVYGGVDKVRKVVRDLVKELDQGASPADVLRRARVPKNTKETLWEVVGNYRNSKELRKALWESYFEFGRTTWRQANEVFVDGKLGILDRYAQDVGVTLDEVAKGNGFSDMVGRAYKDRSIATQLDELVAKTPLGPEFVVKIGTTQHGNEIAKIANRYNLASVSADDVTKVAGATQDQKLLNFVNSYVKQADEAAKEFKKLNDVPKDIAEKAFAYQEEKTLAKILDAPGTSPEELAKVKKRMQELGEIASPSQVPQTAKVLAPYAEEGPMSMARVLYENTDDFFSDVDRYADNVVGRWGETQPVSSKITPELEEAFAEWSKKVDRRMALVKGKALTFAEGMRDFLLHDYNKTYADLAVAYLSPFHYWTNRTYARYLERVMENPRHAAMYLKYRQFMEREHAGLPDWWKYNMQIKGLPGMGDTPLMFNLEATVNPLNGLTGTDFNDPLKRVDWLSATVDDVQKFGPTLMTPINWAVAMHLYNKGEQDAANRWMGRLIPQTQALKAGLSLANIRLPETPFTRHNETDPFVNFLMDGVDPYEERRVGRALGGMVMDGTVDAETAIDSALYKDNQVWDTALERAIDERAAGQLFSFFAGVGFKPRSEGDMQVDQFYNEYFQVMSLRENMSSLEFMNSMDALREKYPFMDTVLIGKRAGPERETAYTYNVLSRIPPGMSPEIAEKFGLDYDLVSRFYDDKGDFSNWSKADKDTFLASITDMGAVLKIPTAANKADWNIAKDEHRQMRDAVVERFGEDIYDKIDHYYSLPNTGEARMFMDANPEVQAAKDFELNYVVNNPQLMKYYGGIDTLDRYYTNQVYDKLEEEFGADITKKEQIYFDIKREEALGIAPKGSAKQYVKENNLSDYWDKKDALKKEALQYLVTFGAKLPENPGPELRPDLTPEQQETVAPREPIDWVAALGGPTVELIAISVMDGEDLPAVLERELEYQAGVYGYSNVDDLLRDVVIDMQQPVQ